MTMDKDRQIAYQVAWKGAIDLIASGKVAVDPAAEVGFQVALVADDLYASLVKALGFGSPETPTMAPVATVTPTRGTTVGAVDPHTPLVTDLNPCPECARAGRNGVLIRNTDPSYRGPEFKCSLQQSRKVGSKFVDVGECDFIDWGRNGKF